MVDLGSRNISLIRICDTLDCERKDVVKPVKAEE